MNLIDVNDKFKTEDQCLDYLEQMRWPTGVRCVTCGADKVSRIERESKTKNKRTRIYQCLEPTCKQQFTATAGTIFHDSHLPLTKWFLAVALIADAKKGVSAKQLQRHLGIGSYRTAWYMAHRIRKSMEESEGSLLSTRLKGTVEVDETYVGGKFDPRRKRARYEKPAVVGLIERGGKVRTMRLNTVSKDTLVGTILNHTDSDAHIMTDEHRGYKSVSKIRKHDSVNHIKEEWVRGNVHTNSIESYWSLFKRGLIGSFHQVSVKHLERYMAEFDYRFNNRKDTDIFIKTIARMCGVGPMQYKQLTASMDGK
jgi:transposase-like protein